MKKKYIFMFEMWNIFVGIGFLFIGRLSAFNNLSGFERVFPILIGLMFFSMGCIAIYDIFIKLNKKEAEER